MGGASTMHDPRPHSKPPLRLCGVASDPSQHTTSWQDVSGLKSKDQTSPWATFISLLHYKGTPLT